ncbi:MAG: hypothetical protein HUJ58_09865, partial [Erysipelotrichaceae bacterium]|nr:hypothetical protein [Erysipelotrichaceae bacterium]
LLEKNTSLLDAVMCNARSAPAYTVSTVLSGKDRIVCVFFAGEKMIAYLEINQKNGVQTKVHVDWIGIDYVGESDATFAYVFRDMQPLENSPFLGLNISEAIRLARTDNKSKVETISENVKVAKPNTVSSILRGFNPQYNCIETVFVGPVTDESVTVMVFYRTDPEFIYKAAGLYTIETLTPDEFESRFADYFFLSKKEVTCRMNYDEYYDVPLDKFCENLTDVLGVFGYGQVEPEERELVEYHVSGELFTPFTSELKPMAFFDNHWFSPSYRFLYQEKDRTE